MQDMDFRMLRGEFVRHLPGAIRGIAVHDQQIHADRQRQKFCATRGRFSRSLTVGTMMSVWFMRQAAN